MTAAMALHVQLIGLDQVMEDQANRIIEELSQLITPGEIDPISEATLYERTKADILGLEQFLNSQIIPMSFFYDLKSYIVSYGAMMER